MRVLVVTKLFPNAREPHINPFNRQQFAALGKLCTVEVLATLPWFPGARLARRWSAAGRVDGVPDHEVIDGLPVSHPRTLYLPRLPGLAAPLYVASLAAAMLKRRGQFDVVLASWLYPDGAAAIALASLLGVPAVVKAHGSDVNVVAQLPGPRRLLRWSLPRAARMVAVSKPLGAELVKLGAPPERVAVVLNGVDEALFHPRVRAAARHALGRAVDEELILYVGRLEASKGVLDLLDAFARLRRPNARLVLLGDGSARAECERRSDARVTLLGAQPLAEVPRWLAACNLLALPSWAEGTPNVVLEALACGRPVVASRVGGIPDLIDDPALGELTPAKDPPALAAALERVLAGTYDEGHIARAGARGGWAQSAARLHAVLEAAVQESHR